LSSGLVLARPSIATYFTPGPPKSAYTSDTRDAVVIAFCEAVVAFADPDRELGRAVDMRAAAKRGRRAAVLEDVRKRRLVTAQDGAVERLLNRAAEVDGAWHQRTSTCCVDNC
jgi:hypothetical protein